MARPGENLGASDDPLSIPDLCPLCGKTVNVYQTFLAGRKWHVKGVDMHEQPLIVIGYTLVCKVCPWYVCIPSKIMGGD